MITLDIDCFQMSKEFNENEVETAERGIKSRRGKQAAGMESDH